MSISRGEKQAALLLALTMFCYAGNHVIGRAVHGELPPLGLSFWRWTFAAVMLFPFIVPKLGKLVPRYRKHWRLLCVLGLLIVGSTTLVLVGLNFTSATNTSLINAAQPTITALLCWIFLQDRLSGRQWFGIVIAFAGVTQIILRADWHDLSFNRGDLIVLLAMFGFATYAINIRRIPSELTVTESLFAVIILGLIPLLPFYLAETVMYKPMPLSWQAVLVVTTLSLLVSVLGMLMWTRGNQLIGPNRAAVYMNLLPLFGAILSVIFLHETIAVHHLIGGVLIGGGMWLVLRKGES
jgi:drug/metabolite transporter (DMT)-like permease